MCDCKVLSGVSFWLCVQNSPGVCPSLDRASSSSLSWCCDGGDGTLTDVCSPLCPSLELSAWRRKKIEMPSQTWIFITSWLHTASLMQFTWNLLKKKHCWSLNYLLFITCGVTWFVYILHCVVVQLRSSLITIAGITPAWWFYLYKPHLSDLSISLSSNKQLIICFFGCLRALSNQSLFPRIVRFVWAGVKAHLNSGVD